LVGISLFVSIILNIFVLAIDHHLLALGVSHQIVDLITKGLVVVSTLIFSTIMALQFGSKLVVRMGYFVSSLVLVLMLFVLPWIIFLPLLLDGFIFL